MKIVFDDNSYLEIKKSDKQNKIIIIISAKDSENFKKKITNSVELDTSEFKEIINNLNL